MKRLVCLIKGHDWERVLRRANYFDTVVPGLPLVIYRCKRCDKTE